LIRATDDEDVEEADEADEGVGEFNSALAELLLGEVDMSSSLLDPLSLFCLLFALKLVW
jgi:hypothetical protein